MTTTAITRQQPADEAIELALVEGDLSRLTSAQRRVYYLSVCQSLDLNPLTRPFEYLRLNGKLLLYAKKDCTDQLRARRGVSIDIVKRAIDHGICEVTAKATLDGRVDTDVGAVYVESLKGEALANAVMKAHTKAKRRVTLSICGLSMPDESEVDSIRGAEVVHEDALARPQLPAPALVEGGPASALWSSLAARVSQSADLAALKGTMADIKKAADQQLLTLTQVAQLRDLSKGKQKELKAGKSVEEVLAGNELPESWQKAPAKPVERCLVCNTAIGDGEPAVNTTSNDGEVGRRHTTCGPFGVDPVNDDLDDPDRGP